MSGRVESKSVAARRCRNTKRDKRENPRNHAKNDGKIRTVRPVSYVSSPAALGDDNSGGRRIYVVSYAARQPTMRSRHAWHTWLGDPRSFNRLLKHIRHAGHPGRHVVHSIVRRQIHGFKRFCCRRKHRCGRCGRGRCCSDNMSFGDLRPHFHSIDMYASSPRNSQNARCQRLFVCLRDDTPIGSHRRQRFCKSKARVTERPRGTELPRRLWCHRVR